MSDPSDLDLLDLSGRRVLVTGAAGGIGRAVVERFLRHGAIVAASHVPEVEDPDTLRAMFGQADESRLSFHALDLRSTQSIRACLDSVVERHGGIDVLVNNAAVGSATVAAWSDDADEQDSLLLGINADGTLKACRHFRSVAGGPNRKIVNIGSVGGSINVFPGFRLADGMSKAAVAFLTRQLAAESVHEDLDVFAVCPGATDTPMFRASTLDPMTAEQRADFLASLPKGRLIDPAEIASVVHFLCGNASRVLHGAVIDASMGLGVRPGIMSEMAGD